MERDLFQIGQDIDLALKRCLEQWIDDLECAGDGVGTKALYCGYPQLAGQLASAGITVSWARRALSKLESSRYNGDLAANPAASALLCGHRDTLAAHGAVDPAADCACGQPEDVSCDDGRPGSARDAERPSRPDRFAGAVNETESDTETVTETVTVTETKTEEAQNDRSAKTRGSRRRS